MIRVPHQFQHGVCRACGVVERLMDGLRESPFDVTPRPHHADPAHSGWASWCPLCVQRLSSRIRVRQETTEPYPRLLWEVIT